jgi:hypothetical protein
MGLLELGRLGAHEGLMAHAAPASMAEQEQLPGDCNGLALFMGKVRKTGKRSSISARAGARGRWAMGAALTGSTFPG